FTFFAAITLGPYHAALLSAFDMLLACHRLRVRPSMYLFNSANLALSTFVAGTVYRDVVAYVAASPLIPSSGREVIAFGLPLVALAATYYGIHISLVAIMLHLLKGIRIWDTIRDTFLLESATFVAAASVAGVLNFTASNFGVLASAVALTLVIPIPLIIYWTFKNYHDKLEEHHRHYREMSEVNDSILQMLAMAIDAKDQTTHEHIQRVRHFASRMGELLGLSVPEVDALKAGAMLHDIGKIGVPGYILNKPGKLTEHEFEQMKMHTIIGADMLSNISFPYPVVPIVRHHHERWDGKGYPDGLRGESIPITARILTLVDNYDALRSDRPYHRGMSQPETLEYLRLNAGTYFDPKLVEKFLAVVDQLEAEVVTLQSPEAERTENNLSKNGAMSAARPAAGFANSATSNRAAAALNSIAETNQRISALWEMSRTLSSSLSLEDTVAILTNRLSKMIPFTTCAISLFDASQSEFEYIHATGHDAEKFIRRRLPVTAGITGWVIQHQRPMYNTNPILDLGFLGHDSAGQYKTAMVFPLVKNQEALGAIAVYSSELDSYSSECILIMEAATQPASDSVYNALSFERAQQAVFSDAETGFATMRTFSAQFKREHSRSRRLAAPLSLLMVRVDDPVATAIKEGCGTGKLLSAVAGIIKEHVHDADLIARYSGDTFLAMLPEKGLTEISELATRLGKSLASTAYSPNLSTNIGFATYPDHGSSLEELLNVAEMSCGARRNSGKLIAPAGARSFLH
ncbi:MAG TPA: HD domain-containing phosphohydrolase, partial [Blastocatellia bacterium]|nr:HD domain-containing phosphohydrolase [Blastocatellia bacterium]